MVDVTQADRDAAADCMSAWYGGGLNFAQIRDGRADDKPYTQAFAAHRETSTASLQAEIAELREAAAQAVAAERERCARIANTVCRNFASRAREAEPGHDDVLTAQCEGAAAARDAIRNEGGNHG